MSLNLTDDESTLVQVMAWCHQATGPIPEPMLTQIYVGIWRHYGLRDVLPHCHVFYTEIPLPDNMATI